MEKDQSAIFSLLETLKSGDTAAFGDLAAMYEPLIAKQVEKYAAGVFKAEIDDLRQTALLALWRAAQSFDLTQSDVTFGLYAQICIANALNSELRVLRQSYTVAASEMSGVSESDDGAGDPSRFVAERESAEALFAFVRSQLSPFENTVWTMRVAGLSAKEIAKALGKEPHSIENAVYRIHSKLRRALREDR